MEEKCNLITLQTLALMQEEYEKDPSSLSPFWQSFFSGIEMASLEINAISSEVFSAFSLIQAYRKWGHLLWKNPEKSPWQLALKTYNLSEKDLEKTVPSFGFSKEKKITLKKLIQFLKSTYSTKIGFEYEHVEEKIRKWIQEKVESPKKNLSSHEKKALFSYLMKAEGLEQFLHTRYTGKKRFSLEGLEIFIPVMDSLLQKGEENGIKKIVIGMPHRGRINLLSNLLGKKYAVSFYEFESFYKPLDEEGGSDVNYHKGFSSCFSFPKGELKVKLIANPSHLESVNPICMGFARAEQDHNFSKERASVLPVIVHGDASISGQGVVYECLQMTHLEGYEVGGVLHIVLDNEIGFTASSKEGRSTLYPTDIAKSFGFPVFHVRAEDSEEALFTVEIASLIRKQFGIDVFIHVVGYRKYGHNETDEPFFTQPLEYEKIRKRKSIPTLYLEKLVEEKVLSLEEAETEKKAFFAYLETEKEVARKYQKTPPSFSDIYGIEKEKEVEEDVVQTTVSSKRLFALVENYTKVPDGFFIHPKLEKFLQRKKELEKIDFAFAETLAFASLLEEGIPIRLSGEDSGRGTFSQRHAIWIDQKTGASYIPLNQVKKGQAPFSVYNSHLSEMGVMGFEYGYNQAFLQGLTLWEGQYGDFANGAQVIIDQYISSSFKKWGERSSLTLLLPHGYEGGGPEHSSARIERFLQMSADNNWCLVNPSTPAQYFHILRRQALCKKKRPLIVFTPKSLLRNPFCISSYEELTKGAFSSVIEETGDMVERILFCSGKIYYELLEKRREMKKKEVLLIRIESLYPVDTKTVRKIAEKNPSVKKVFWVQEEPENMGAWKGVLPYIKTFFPSLTYIGRKKEEAPSGGAFSEHVREQKEIIEKAFA